MTRFLGACLLLAAACIAAMIVLGALLRGPPEDRPAAAVVRREAPGPGGRGPGDRSAPDRVVIVREEAAGGAPQALVVPDAAVLPSEQQEVPAEHDGKLLFLATEAAPDEKVPPDRLIRYQTVTLGIRVPTEQDWLALPAEERLRDSRHPDSWYRRAGPDDELAPGQTAVVRQERRYRKLNLGDRVTTGQLLGLINPALAVDDLAIKQAKLEAAEADVHTTVAMKEESKRRLDTIVSLRNKFPGAVTKDDYGIAKVTLERYREEEVSKREAVRQAQRELEGALTTLNMHEIRAAIDGVIAAIDRRDGEAVKANEPVLLLQSTRKLRVEGEVDLQDALPLRDRVHRARALRKEAEAQRAEARAHGKEAPASAVHLEHQAERLLAVEIDPTRVTARWRRCRDTFSA
jgi:hypothetical protein